MFDLAEHPITRRWPAKRPGRLQLYSMPTPNGVKVSAMLEETGLPYEPHRVDITEDEQFTPEFLALNPNNKIPAILDPDGPGGESFGLWETGAILLYLAEKTGKLLPTDQARRHETQQWLMWQMGGVGPMFGQFGHFWKVAADKTADDYGIERYAEETRRLLSVLEGRLAGRDWIMGEDYTVADVATWPWVRVLGGFYDAAERLGLDDYPRVGDWLERATARPASKAAVEIPGKD